MKTSRMRFIGIAGMICLSCLLVACDSSKKAKHTPGERIDVVTSNASVTPDAVTQGLSVEVPDQVDLPEWKSRNDAMLTPHIGLTGISNHERTTIGSGDSFSVGEAPAPLVVDGVVIAMDASGNVSAHQVDNLGTRRWSVDLAEDEHVDEVLGGGFATADGIVYATAGFGKLAAIELSSGKVLWNVRVGAPVRGAPAVASAEKRVIVLTADNQTLAFDTADGALRWEHRGIHESASYFSTTAPVVSDGIAIVCYSSGEVFALRAETGNVLWSDTVASAAKTSATAVFNGIDADPIVQDGVVVATSASGQMQASALLNGRPLWQAKVGSHSTPWSAGNALFALSTTHDVVAIIKRDGTVRWSQSLAQKDDKNKDVTPPLYGPILAGNAVVVITADGKLRTFRPQDGDVLGTYDIADDVISAPVIAGGALYLVTRDARLHKYY